MWGLLFTVACLAGAPEKSPGPAETPQADEAQTTLRRMAQLPAAQQRDWLRHVEQRFNWASQITMPGEDAKREEARIDKLLRQPKIAWDDLVELLHQTDQREKSAVSKLVRQYRQAVNNRYGGQVRTMQERQDAWYLVWSAWEAAGRPAEQQDRLLDWLADAIRITSRETVDRLPAEPRFGPGGNLSPESVPGQPQLADRGKSSNNATPSQPSDGARQVAGVVDRPLMLWRTSPPPQDRLADHLAIMGRPNIFIVAIEPRHELLATYFLPAGHYYPATWLPQPISCTPLAGDDSQRLSPIAILTRRDSGVRPKFDATQSVVVANQALPEIRDIAEAVGSESTRDLPQLPERGSRKQAEGSNDALPNVYRLPPTIAGPALPSAPSFTASALPAIGEEPRRLPQEEHLAATLPKSLLESSLPPASSNRSAESQANNIASVAVTPEPQARAEVNIEELTSRIAGINLSLRTLEGELSVKKSWTVDQLGALVERLDILVLRQKDLALFRDLVTAEQRIRAGAIDSPKAAIAAIATHVRGLRVHFQTTAPAADDSQRTAILHQLEALADRLTALSVEATGG